MEGSWLSRELLKEEANRFGRHKPSQPRLGKKRRNVFFMFLYWTSPSNPQTPAPTQRTVISHRKLSTSPGVEQDGWDCSKSRKQKPRRRLMATRVASPPQFCVLDRTAA